MSETLKLIRKTQPLAGQAATIKQRASPGVNVDAFTKESVGPFRSILFVLECTSFELTGRSVGAYMSSNL